MAKNCGCSDSIAVNGIYTSPVDLNSLIKPGKFKVKLGENRPNMTTKCADALVTVSKHEHCIIQSVLILSGMNAGKTYTRSSFTDGTTWSEFVTSSNPEGEEKLDKNFDNFSNREPLEPGDMFAVWSGEDIFRISAESLKEFISGEHNKGYVNRVSNLKRIPGQKGDYIVVLETMSIWLWDENKETWVDSTPVHSVNNQTGNITITAEDILGIDIDNFVEYINKIVNVLNSTKFMSHFYSGYTTLGNIQRIPGISIRDNLLLTFGGIILKQGSDFVISNNNEITIIGVEVGRDVPIHVFKIEAFDLPRLISNISGDDGTNTPDNGCGCNCGCRS